MSAVCDRLRERAVYAAAEPALVSRVGAQETVWSWAELERATAGLVSRIDAAACPERPCVLLGEVDNGAPSVLDLIAMMRTELPVAVVTRTAPPPEAAQLREVLLRSGCDVLRLRDGGLAVSPARRRAEGKTAMLPPESVLLATGGSSGKPKVVVDALMRTIGRRPRPARPSTLMNWRPGQRQMVVGPLSHTATLTFFVEGLSDGNTMIVQRSFDPAATLAAMADWRVEWLQLTPYHLRHLAFAARRCGDGLSSVRGLLHLAAPCPGQLKRYWIERLGADRLFEMYGSTEGVGLTLVRGDEWLKRPGTVGRGFFTQIQVRDESGLPLPPGETGEVYMRSGRSARAVYLDARDRIRVTPDGFASVGDCGHLDGDGYLYLAPRQLRRIQVGGETVYPGEVESVLLDHPDVLDAAVLGISDERLGETLVALIVSAGHPDARQLRRYLRARMPPHKVPRTVTFVGRLPRGETGKLERARLAELAAAHRLADLHGSSDESPGASSS
jgi:bile acid-coenzyme A ligase